MHEVAAFDGERSALHQRIAIKKEHHVQDNTTVVKREADY